MDEIPSTRASLLVRLREPRDERAWSEFVMFTPLVYRLARRRGLRDAGAIDRFEHRRATITQIAS
jgi:hypothetical protein